MNTTPPASSTANFDNSDDSPLLSDEQRIITAVLEVERHAHDEGWDGPPKLFALGRLDSLMASEPEFVAALQLNTDGQDSDPLTLIPIEQEWESLTGPLDEALAKIMWPEQVVGAAITMERIMLPPEAEADVASEPDSQTQQQLALNHPQRQDMRVAVAVLRAGPQMCAIRVRAATSNEPVVATATDPEQSSPSLAELISDPEVVTGVDLVPGLVDALRATFEDDQTIDQPI